MAATPTSQDPMIGAPSSEETLITLHDDFSLVRVPESARYGWVSVAMQRFGMLSALAQFMLAASIGVGLSFWDAMIAITLGSVILEVVSIFLGIAGVKEGLSTSVLARWSGFGTVGSALVGLVMATSLVGWFAVQNAVFAEGLHSLVPAIPMWIWAIVGGLVVTAVVTLGFAAMSWVAWIAVPAFLLVCVWSVSKVLSDQGMALFSSGPSGQPISLAAATTFVAGGFIVGAIFTPDMSRYNRSVADVVKQTVVGVTLGEYFVGVIGVLLAHALKVTIPGDAGAVVGIIQSTSGVLGVLVLVVSIVKVNDWNLYPSSLGVVNAVDVLAGIRLPRAGVALGLGALGAVLSAVGFAKLFQPFLLELGVVCPPIAAIMIADYFVCRSWRVELAESRERGELPAVVPMVVPAGLLAWVLGYLAGRISMEYPEFLWGWNIPSLTSLVVAFGVYVLAGRCGLARGANIRPLIRHWS
ncbi:hypothetical protein KEM60_00088 [Austwickia sp. TVS 96-490-7B]|uniref:purine-cytosine permease family protein n=1 Tax=Austwickia sp. TVS 96-490-7B TaxID=2830843 RepID=UPI001D678B7B|nr:cytosine permease [Austwickia sp. TVS 96-490-7B]MBW3083906.1 hypothetical protein [Austwickia sp. TVS 96-490-7B]